MSFVSQCVANFLILKNQKCNFQRDNPNFSFYISWFHHFFYSSFFKTKIIWECYFISMTSPWRFRFSAWCINLSSLLVPQVRILSTALNLKLTQERNWPPTHMKEFANCVGVKLVYFVHNISKNLSDWCLIFGLSLSDFDGKCLLLQPYA